MLDKNTEIAHHVTSSQIDLLERRIEYLTEELDRRTNAVTTRIDFLMIGFFSCLMIGCTISILAYLKYLFPG